MALRLPVTVQGELAQGTIGVFLEAIPTLGWTAVTQLQMKGTANHINGSCLHLFGPLRQTATDWVAKQQTFVSLSSGGWQVQDRVASRLSV